MTEIELHVTPSARAVADLVDSYTLSAARERWGWLSYDVLRKLANEGRYAAGRSRTVGSLHDGGAAHEILNAGWDGPMPGRLATPAAAEALGLSESTLTLGNA